MLKTYAVKVTDFPIKYLDSIYSYLPKERCTKLQRFYSILDTIRGVTGDILARVVLSEMMNKPVHQLEFSTDYYGKPSLIGFEEQIGFNVSHSGDWVALVVSTSKHVGVDIEELQKVDLQIAHRFFTEEEYISIINIVEEKYRSLQFLKIWTAKESYIKAIGKGLSIPLDSFSTITDKEMARVKRIDNKDWYFQQYSIDSNYLITTCTEMDHLSEEVQIFDLHSIVNYFLK